MAVHNAAIVKRLYADLASRDLAAVQACLAPDVAWTVARGFPYAGTHVGFGAIAANMLERLAADWNGFRHELESFVECGEDVLVSGRYHGIWKRTGEDIDAAFVHHFSLRQGKISRVHQYVDLPSTYAVTDGFVHAASIHA